MTNVAKHARAERTTLTLEASDATVRMTVADAGIGFDATVAGARGERQGWGGRDGDTLLNHLYQDPLDGVFYDAYCIVPNNDGKPVSRMGAVVDQEKFEKLKDEYYKLRGWNVGSGYQTRETLENLDLKDIANDLEQGKLLR